MAAAGVSLLLPETRGIKLPDTVEEVEGIQLNATEMSNKSDTKVSKESLVGEEKV